MRRTIFSRRTLAEKTQAAQGQDCALRGFSADHLKEEEQPASAGELNKTTIARHWI
jgi:hypothetical protein